jgi:hypothetical protein
LHAVVAARKKNAAVFSVLIDCAWVVTKIPAHMRFPASAFAFASLIDHKLHNFNVFNKYYDPVPMRGAFCALLGRHREPAEIIDRLFDARYEYETAIFLTKAQIQHDNG